ncbi:hypothetical protein A7P53_01845 [Acinetobacter defluvii]|uniref:hypothetical protein n=1 Tax=Acinetobacter defluvii TaxID=1871111 RepID=UPI0014904517|nr:hypothetical protein [Acinetobacter defluvii]NNP74247.1 hypothetical protein [Acinetobacter defluvii]
MTIKYVIRRNDFSYNDEWYQTHQAAAGSIQAIYTDQAEAIQAYKQLVVDALYEDGELCNYDIGNGYASEETYEKLEKFVLEKTGEEFEIDDEIPEMELDDAFEFAQISGVLHYQLIEIDQQKPIYILWSNEEQDYLRSENYNIFDSTDENFNTVDDLELYIFENDFNEHVFDQSLEKVSESPEILKSLVLGIPALVYAEDRNCILNIDWEDISFSQLKAINTLLKNPIFEVRQVTLEQLNKITNGEENE